MQLPAELTNVPVWKVGQYKRNVHFQAYYLFTSEPTVLHMMAITQSEIMKHIQSEKKERKKQTKNNVKRQTNQHNQMTQC